MKNIKADVAFLPIDGIYTMSAKEAADAANMIKPAVAQPIHFDQNASSVQFVKNYQTFFDFLDKSIYGVLQD